MKNILKQNNLPFLLLIGLIVKSILISSPVFDSVGIVALSSLFGFKLWLDHVKKPDYNADLAEIVDQLADRVIEQKQELAEGFDTKNKQIVEEINKINLRLSSVAGNVAISQKTTNKPNFKWGG